MKIRKTTYEKEKLWLIQPSKLYDKLLNIYTTQRKKLSEDQKKKNDKCRKQSWKRNS